jgi:hypothetical protein
MVETEHDDQILFGAFDEAFIECLVVVLWTQLLGILKESLELVRVEETGNLARTDEAVYFLVEDRLA